MKKIVICFILIFIHVYSTHSFSQATHVNSGYGLFCKSTDSDTGLINIKFILTEQSYVKIYSVDVETGSIEMIVDGTISEGQHGVIYKIIPIKKPDDLICVMEVYEEKGKLIYKTQSEIY